MNYVVIKVKKSCMYYCGFINNKPTFTERMIEAYVYEFGNDKDDDNQLDQLYMSEHFHEDLMKINMKLFIEYSMLESLGHKIELEYFDDTALLLYSKKEE